MSLPFLPEPEAVVAATQKKASKRTLILWVALIVMFLTIWQFLSPAPRSGVEHDLPSAPPVAEASSSFGSWGIATLAPGLVFFFVFVVFMRAYRQTPGQA